MTNKRVNVPHSTSNFYLNAYNSKLTFDFMFHIQSPLDSARLSSARLPLYSGSLYVLSLNQIQSVDAVPKYICGRFSVHSIFPLCIYSSEWNAVYHFILFNFWTSVRPTKCFHSIRLQYHVGISFFSGSALFFRYYRYYFCCCIYYFHFWSISIRWLFAKMVRFD